METNWWCCALCLRYESCRLDRLKAAENLFTFVSAKIHWASGSQRGGIGRRARLKIWYPKGCVGSTPSAGTTAARLPGAAARAVVCVCVVCVSPDCKCRASVKWIWEHRVKDGERARDLPPQSYIPQAIFR